MAIVALAAVIVAVVVGVLGNQGACVIAKSYEMKAAGVKTGDPDLGPSGCAPTACTSSATSAGTRCSPG